MGQEKINQDMLLKNNQVGFTIRKTALKDNSLVNKNKKNHKSTLKTLQVWQMSLEI